MKSETTIIDKEDRHYPDLLKQIKKAPEKLFARGDLKLLNSKCIAIVGSRKCSDYGIKMAQNISRQLLKNGITVVSGLATRN